MNMKRIMLFAVILIIAISSVSIVSAGLFDFLGGNEKIETDILCSDGTGEVSIQLCADEKDGYFPLNNKTILVNFTDESGKTYSFENVTNDKKEFANGSVTYDWNDLKPGNYTVDVVFLGDDKYNSSSEKDEVEIYKPKAFEGDVEYTYTTEVQHKDSNGYVLYTEYN